MKSLLIRNLQTLLQRRSLQTSALLPSSSTGFFRCKYIGKAGAEEGLHTPALTKYMIYNLSRNNAFDSSKAKKDLGYKTRPFHETIRDEIAWLKEIGKLQGTNTVNTVSFND